MEEFRPILVDSFALRLVNRLQLTPADFGPPEEEPEPEDLALGGPTPGSAPDTAAPSRQAPIAVHLRGTGRKVFLSAFYSRLRETAYHPASDSTLSYRQIIMQEVYRFARVLKGEERSYESFALR